MRLIYKALSAPDGKFLPWVNSLANRSGVYIIRSLPSQIVPLAETETVVLYVGESHTNRLADTLKRHFSPWEDAPERVHHVYDRDSVQVAIRLTPSKSAQSAQNNLIRRLKPRDNGNGPIPESQNPF